MKQITNWRNATVGDCEANGLLKEATRLHVLGFKLHDKDIKTISGYDHARWKNCFQYHIDNKIPFVIHNGILFDVRLFEKILDIDLSELMLIDTLALSWYLNISRSAHGLGTFLPDYGIEKPEVGEEEWVGTSDEERAIIHHYENNLHLDSFEGLSKEQIDQLYTETKAKEIAHQELMHLRVTEDVKINYALWEDLKERLIEMYTVSKEQIDAGLVGGKRVSDDEVIYIDSLKGLSVDEHIDRLLTFLMFKMDCAALQEKTKWLADREHLLKVDKELDEEILKSKSELESVMPKIPTYTKKNIPKDPYKKNGELSASGLSWEQNVKDFNEGKCDEFGTPLVIYDKSTPTELKVLKGYKPPNADSPAQIKDFLFANGWEPEVYKTVKDKEAIIAWEKGGRKRNQKPVNREVPQITVDDDGVKVLCRSVLRLAEDVPEIMAYSKYSTVKHRSGVIKGFLENMDENNYLEASIKGFTNTIRVKHKNIVNLVGVDKMYGEAIRGSLISGKGKISLGSDLSSLEDRTKHHFMLPHDPEYVATMMADDFDPHILMALFAGLIEQYDFDEFKKGNKTNKAKSGRKSGKTTNYAAVYNAGAPTIAKAAKVDIATGQKLYDGYWRLNWSVKAIAEEQVTFTDKRNQTWLINPINGFCYSLRKENDRFSTLCQGSGSYFFDCWVDFVLEGMMEVFGKKSLTGSFHDEIIIVLKDQSKFRDALHKIVKDGIHKVNEKFMLRRTLDNDIQFGYKYSDIH